MNRKSLIGVISAILGVAAAALIIGYLPGAGSTTSRKQCATKSTGRSTNPGCLATSQTHRDAMKSSGHEAASAQLTPVRVDPSQPGALLPAGTIVDQRVARPIILDGGALRIDPAPATVSAAFTLKKALSVAQAATAGAVHKADLDFGIMHLAGALTAGLPSYNGVAAWVAIRGPQSVEVSCLPTRRTTQHSFRPRVEVLLMDAQTGGDVLDYVSRGTGPCGGRVGGPSVQRAKESLSIPWTAVGETPVSEQELHELVPPGATLPTGRVNWTIRYTVPRCTASVAPEVDDPLNREPTLWVRGERPVSPPASCTPANTITRTWGPESVPIAKVRHAPTGIKGLDFGR